MNSVRSNEIISNERIFSPIDVRPLIAWRQQFAKRKKYNGSQEKITAGAIGDIENIALSEETS